MEKLIQKRSNPFEKKPVVTKEEKKEQIVESYNDTFDDFPEEQPAVERNVAPQHQQRQYQSYQTIQSNHYMKKQDTVVRDKYTSTMDQSLRRKIKIACATRGIMFAQFVEEACREKLSREGVK